MPNHRIRDFLSLRSRNAVEATASQSPATSETSQGAPVSGLSTPNSTGLERRSDHESFPKDLWQAAFDQLDDRKKATLLELKEGVDNNPSSRSSLVEKVIKQTEDKYSEYKKRGWKIKRKGKEDVNVRDKAKAILSSALRFKGLIDSVVGFDPTGHASSAWAIVSLGLQMVKNDQDGVNAMFDASGYLANLLARYGDIEAHYLGYHFVDSTQLGKSIVNIYVAILDYSAGVAAASERNPFKRAMDSFLSLIGQPLQKLKDEVNKREEDVKQWRELIGHQYREREFELTDKKADKMLDNIDTMTVKVTRIEKAVWTSEQENLLRWLSSVDVSSSYHRLRKLQERDTGQWLLTSEKFEAWKESPASFLWLYGISGCGKSVLSSTIIENISAMCDENPAYALAYWYFDFNDKDKQDAGNMLRSLIRQLAAASDEVPQVIYEIASKHRAAGREPDQKDLFSALQSIIASIDKDVFLVIDALDECPLGTQRSDLLRHTRKVLEEKHENLHILATSRREQDIQASLGSSVTAIDIASLLEGDVKLFIQGRLENQERLSRWNPAVKSLIETKLLEVKEVFRWAALQLDGLQECRNRADIEETLRNIPKTLEATYERILTQLPEKDIGKVRPILLWLSCSLRPLTLQEVAAVASLEFPEDVLQICTSSLVTPAQEELIICDVQQTCEVVRLAHFSVQEYLLSERLKSANNPMTPSFFVFLDPAHVKIGESCLSVLLKMDDGNISLDNLEKEPLIKYSAEYWHKHTTFSENSNIRKGALFNSIERLLDTTNPAYLNWIRTRRLGNPQEHQPIHTAAKFGLLENAKRLLDRGVNIDPTAPSEGLSSLMLATSEGHGAIVDMLLRRGAAIDRQNSISGETALYIACTQGHEDLVRLLLQNDAKIDLKDRSGWTALHSTSARGYSREVNLLVEYGFDPRLRNKGDRTTLHFTSDERYERIVSLLLEYKADPEIHDVQGRTALHSASQWRFERIVSLLLEHGADPNLPDDQGLTAMHLASHNGHESIVSLLLEHGADPKIQDVQDRTALHDASRYGSERTVSLLLEYGADPKIRDEYGCTALHDASIKGDERIVSLLLEYEAHPNIRDNDGVTALSHAKEQGYPAIVQLLAPLTQEDSKMEELEQELGGRRLGQKTRMPAFWDGMS